MSDVIFPEPDITSRTLGKALAALDFDICDRCLGRLFARMGFGLTNGQRGSSIRTLLGMVLDGSDTLSDLDRDLLSRIPIHNVDSGSTAEDPDAGVVEEEWNIATDARLPVPWTDDERTKGSCWLCEDVFDTILEMRGRILEASELYEFHTFQVGTKVEQSISFREQRLWERVVPDRAEPIKEEYNRELGKSLFELWPHREHDKNAPEISFVTDPVFRTVELQVKPLFIIGRYNKLERGIPQTRWICNRCSGKGCPHCSETGKMYQTSVEELIGVHFLKAAMGTNYKLHGMGREDIDVITLGRGRPFVLEISEPMKRTLDLNALMEAVNANGKVLIRELSITTRDTVRRIKESRAIKHYRAKVRINGPWDEEMLKYGISLLGQSPINQRTPDRVSHRRADLTRERLVHEAWYETDPGGGLFVHIRGDAGLYIKELMHGDGGRTSPSLAEALGCEVSVEYLDVLDIED
ncbi:MAG: tRNA pseudouridine(54/55) synthase Pus10 [Candidatus Thermoplasmatota archaeon]|nr:tRNA pseudouridine(54/55) synthase Pus10 [Candidatus Thermoplasmatota archaeon]